MAKTISKNVECEAQLHIPDDGLHQNIHRQYTRKEILLPVIIIFTRNIVFGAA